ncbi:hypothetical protein ACFQY5_26455 [Paeniroseomonas aquatica]|uniref:hypothetical protein n=1 Tax=Paeniroseomonas aquatica TaxID=373043 RepID=UPI00361E0CE4
MIVLCLGMQGSASTFTFNVVRDLLAAGGGSVAGFEATGLAAVEAALRGCPDSVVVRAHTLSASLLALVAAAGGRFVVTTRDPRDCVASLRCRLGGDAACWAMDVARSLAAVGTVLQRPGIRPFAFEEGFAADPDIGPRLAAALGLSLDPQHARRVAAGWSPGKVGEVLAALARQRKPDGAGFRSDPATGFNEAHLGDGRVGKWAEVLPPRRRPPSTAASAAWGRSGTASGPAIPSVSARPCSARPPATTTTRMPGRDPSGSRCCGSATSRPGAGG